jgi:outer membrane lipoprotein-sorting protein
MTSRFMKLALALCLPLLLSAGPLEEVLAQMDAGAQSFAGVKAKIRKASYTAVIDDLSEEIGTFAMTRKGAKTASIQMKIDFTEPDERAVAFSGRKGEIYYPKIKTVHEYDLGKHKSLVESFLLLGFGTSGKQLAKDYTVKYVGEEEMAGVATHHLEMVPKSKKAREKFSQVDMWVAKEGAYPVQQKFIAAGGDYSQLTYMDVEINPKLAASDLELKLPAGVKREYPQK